MAFDNDRLVLFFLAMQHAGVGTHAPEMELGSGPPGEPRWTCAFVRYGAYAKSGCYVDSTSYDNPRDMLESSDFLPGCPNLIPTISLQLSVPQNFQGS